MGKRAGARCSSRILVVLAVAACVLAARPGSAQDPTATASGTLILNGSHFALHYAYAAAEPGFFDKTTEDIKILLSDVALSQEARDDVFALIRLGREDEAHVVEVVLDRTGGAISGAIYAKDFGGMVSVTGMHQFERRRLEYRVVDGRLWMKTPSEFSGVTFEYDAAFSAVIPRPPTPAEVAALLASPTGVAARGYLDALLSGALERFRQTLSAGAAEDYRGPEGAARFAVLRTDMPRDSKVVSVNQLSDTSAKAVIQGHARRIVIEYVLSMALEDGVWKVGK